LLLGSKTASTNGGTDEEHMTTGLGGVQRAANPATKHSGGPEEWEPHLGGERVVEGIHYGWLMKDHLARYHFAAQYCRGMRVLDVATGTGYGANILAWANGLGESFRKRIRPIEEPLRRSSLLKPHYFAMIGLCKESEAPHVECKDSCSRPHVDRLELRHDLPEMGEDRRVKLPRDLVRSPRLAFLCAALLAAVLLVVIPQRIAQGGYLNHVSGAWAALASDFAHGVLYRPLLSQLGYGGTRYFPAHIVLHGLLMRLGLSVRTAGHLLPLAAACLLVGGGAKGLAARGARPALAWALALLALAS
jgi:hypothetical protein